MKNYDNKTNYLVSGKTFNEISAAVNWVDQQNGTTVNEVGAKLKEYANGEIRAVLFHETFPQFAAVYAGDMASKLEDDEYVYEIPALRAGRYTSSDEANNRAWAVLTEAVDENDSIVKAVVSGITPAKVNIKSSSHRFVRPVADSETGEIESCESGTARILAKTGDETGVQWCIIQLGGGGSSSGYRGSFTVLDASDGSGAKVKICNGGNPQSETAGKVDVVGDVDSEVLELSSDTSIYIVVEWDEDSEEYTYHFDTDYPYRDPCAHVELAYCYVHEGSEGQPPRVEVVQSWMEGNIYLQRWLYV